MNDKTPVIIAFGAIILAGISIGIAGMAFNSDSVNELSEFTSNRLNDHETTAKKLDTRITENHDTIATERLNNVAMAKTILKLEDQTTQQQIDIAILKARGDLTTQPTTDPTPTSTIDLRLKVSDNKGNTKSQGYPRDVPAILIQGESAFQGKSFLITIKDPNGAFVKDKFGDTLSDGDISEAWIPSGNPIAGTYTVTIKIDLKTDSIQFILL